MKHNSFSLLLSFLLPLGAINARVPQQTPEKAAQFAAESWMRLIEDGKYSESWDEASQFLRARISKDKWKSRCASLTKTSGELGQLKSRNLKKALLVESLPDVRGQQGVILIYESSFSKLGPRSATLEMVLGKGDVWRIAFYEGLEIAPVLASRPEDLLVDPRQEPPHAGTAVGFPQSWRLEAIPPGSPESNREAVDRQPIALNNPQPTYTDAARKNKIQGTVFTHVLIGADGNVKRVTVIRGLPDGLNQMAIQTANQMRFRPAMKGGEPVAYWMSLQIDFTL